MSSDLYVDASLKITGSQKLPMLEDYSMVNRYFSPELVDTKNRAKGRVNRR